MDSLPELFKIKTPEIYSEELSNLYDFLFDVVGAGWVGSCGHYAYGESYQVADHQDGFIYCFIHCGARKITASCRGNITFSTLDAREIKIEKYGYSFA